MVQCRFRNYQDQYLELRMKGHAGFASENDIVCSAVSTLAYAFVIGAVNIGAKYVTSKDNPGDFLCCVRVMDMDNDDKASAYVIFNTIYVTLRKLAGQYEDNIKVEMVRE